jgi:predicted Zn-dependent protease
MRSIGSFFIFLVILLLAVAVLLSYFSSSNDYNPVTGKAQDLFMDITEETLLGGIMQETVITREGGLCPDPKAAAVVLSAGRKLSGVGFLQKSPWNFSFYLLSDSTSAALYANPDGSVLITKALYDRLVTEDQLAALLAHGIGHIVARHTTVYLDREKSKGTIDISHLNLKKCYATDPIRRLRKLKRTKLQQLF